MHYFLITTAAVERPDVQDDLMTHFPAFQACVLSGNCKTLFHSFQSRNVEMGCKYPSSLLCQLIRILLLSSAELCNQGLGLNPPSVERTLMTAAVSLRILHCCLYSVHSGFLGKAASLWHVVHTDDLTCSFRFCTVIVLSEQGFMCIFREPCVTRHLCPL